MRPELGSRLRAVAGGEQEYYEKHIYEHLRPYGEHWDPHVQTGT